MIIGIGTDLTSVERIGQTLETQGERFIARCFAESERPPEGAKPAAFYAKRWAAKEACAKALGLGIRDGIHLKDIAVKSDTAGKPALSLSGGAKDRLTAITPAGMTSEIHVSLTDDAGMALAFVVISAHGKT